MEIHGILNDHFRLIAVLNSCTKIKVNYSKIQMDQKYYLALRD